VIAEVGEWESRMVGKDSELLLILNSVWDHDVGCGP
jgi:hypothetical protein